MLPTPEGSDMWAQIVASAQRMVLHFFEWLEYALPVIIPSGVAAWLFGQHFGYRDAALKLYVATGIFVSVVGTPVVLHFFGLDVALWRAVVCCSLSVFCFKIVKWGEEVIRQKLGLERRKPSRGDEA